MIEWQLTPIDQIPPSGYFRRSGSHKVNLPPRKHLDLEKVFVLFLMLVLWIL